MPTQSKKSRASYPTSIYVANGGHLNARASYRRIIYGANTSRLNAVDGVG